MGINTRVGWTNHTINFWAGCDKVSEGCKYCYMYRDWGGRFKKDPKEVVQISRKTIMKTLAAAQPGDMIFTCSFSDFFIEQADQWRNEAWAIIRAHPQFIWQILTKRPERAKFCLPSDWGKGWPNVWIGASAENQQRYNERLPHLINIPAQVRFLSLEPLLGPIDLNLNAPVHSQFEQPVKKINSLAQLSHYIAPKGPTVEDYIKWVIVGGESGFKTGDFRYRPMQMSWVKGIIDQCQYVPLFVKQLGTYLAEEMNLVETHGADITEFPEWARVQQFPEIN